MHIFDLVETIILIQEEVLDRAKKAKEKAAREATEAQPQGLVSESAAYTEVVVDSASSGTSYSSTDSVTSVQSTDTSETSTEPTIGEDPTLSS